MATRHNVGFMVVDRLASRHCGGPWAEPGPYRLCPLPGRPELLAQPLTYMNRSGTALLLLTTTYALTPEQVLVVVDDIDLPLGRLRLRPSGGPGSHNGLRDIVDAIGPAFPRLRLGVRGDEPWDDLADYVTSDFETPELPALEPLLDRACDAVEHVLAKGLAAAMNEFNRVVDPPPDAAS